MNRLIRWLVFTIAALTTVASAQAKLVVDQVYSNANGAIQFIVFVVEGDPGCNEFSVISYESGGESWPGVSIRPPSGRILVATPGFAALGIVKPDFESWGGLLNLAGGSFRFCGDGVFAYRSLPVDGVTALDRFGALVANAPINSLGASGSVTSLQAASVNMAPQDGHTGSWYETATGGQGFEIDVAFNEATWDTNVFASWFTYDVADNGPSGQRWYTLSGAVAFADDGDSWAALGIYQNIGGNFDAPPITTARKVGSATLRFTACDAGSLDFAFTDGSGRSGSIPITRITRNVYCAATWRPPQPDTDAALSGTWYDPETSGQGFSVEINPLSQVAFLAWYTYAPGGANAGVAGQRWYTAQGSYAAGMRKVPVTLYETTGGRFDAPTLPPPRTTAVGNATLEFQSCSAATLTYAFTGGSSAGAKGSIPLTRAVPVSWRCAR